jgi:hypothetical protein
MTPNPRQLPSQRARSLQIRLNHGGVDPVTAATEASRIFFDSGDTVRSRWLGFELNGYGHSVDVAPLHEVLSVPHHARLAVQVTAYRTQRGRVATLDGQVVEFRHFFVEPLRDLLSTRAHVAQAGGGPVELQFAVSPAAPDHPLHGCFSPDVFDRVVASCFFQPTASSYCDSVRRCPPVRVKRGKPFSLLWLNAQATLHTSGLNGRN